MKETYKILPSVEAVLAEPTIQSAEVYARFIVKCAPRQINERLGLARQFGWDAEEVKDEIFYAQYQKERAKILFPNYVDAINAGSGSLDVSEVDQAEANFTKLTGIALSEPSISLNELEQLLAQLISTSSMVDINLTHTNEQE